MAAIISGLKDGALDAIATDHAPQTVIEKDVEFDHAANGIIGLETALPLTLRLVHQGHLTLMEAIQKLTVAPARILGLDQGRLKVGGDADLTLIDVDREQTIDAGRFKSKSRNCPFAGWSVKGRAVGTLVAGQVMNV